jgi:hypothetical protein
VIAAPPAVPARVSLTASPAHLVLDAGSRKTIRVGAAGGRRIVLHASVAGFALDLRGRPRIIKATDAAPWLTVRPRTLTLGSPRGAELVVFSRLPPAARPGDHSAVVLLTAVTPSARGMAVQMRIGLVVTVRVKGRRVSRLAVVGARARHPSGGHGSVIDVTLANRGNVIESLAGGRLRVILIRRGRVVARLRPGRRKVLPRATALVAVRYRGRLRGPLTARIELAGPGGRTARRSFHLRL